MKVSDLFQPGDKIDIKLTYQVERQHNGENIEVKVYKSKLLDLLSDKILVISMPTESGKMIMFQTGLRCEVTIFGRSGIYKVNATARDRYKKDNIYMVSMELLSEPVKFQRRDYFRVPYVSKMKYYRVQPEVSRLETTEDLFIKIHNPNNGYTVSQGIIQDISGGGIKFASAQSERVGAYIVAEIRLMNDKIDETFFLLCRIVSSEQVKDSDNKISNRAKFIYKDLKDREKIVRFVFEEERRIRNKVSG